MANSNSDQWIVFGSYNEEFGLSILDIYEINFVPEITPVVISEPHMLGIINLRGSVISVFDLRSMLGKPKGESNKKQRVIIARSGDRIIGLLVDYVSQVLRIDPSDVVPPPESLSPTRISHIDAVYKIEHGIISQINLHHLLENVTL